MQISQADGITRYVFPETSSCRCLPQTLCVRDAQNNMKIPKEKLTRFMQCSLDDHRLVDNQHYKNGEEKSKLELLKRPSRTVIINYLLSKTSSKTTYLEIGVRNPNHNYNHVIADYKYSVDPGVEFKENPVDFKMTSDEFFELLSSNKILSSEIKFDLIFIDGLHLAEQVDRDILNSMKYIKNDGFIVIHDCNPPTEWHARDSYSFYNSPARGFWNGTTWKAFLKWRFNPSVNSCCINSDWGVGILSKKQLIGKSIKKVNPFFEFNDFDENRNEYLNLISFDDLNNLLSLE